MLRMVKVKSCLHGIWLRSAPSQRIAQNKTGTTSSRYWEFDSAGEESVVEIDSVLPFKLSSRHLQMVATWCSCITTQSRVIALSRWYEKACSTIAQHKHKPRAPAYMTRSYAATTTPSSFKTRRTSRKRRMMSSFTRAPSFRYATINCSPFFLSGVVRMSLANG